MTKAKKLRLLFEAIGLYAGTLTIPWLPRRAVVMMAVFFGTAGSVLCRKLSRIAMANLVVAYGESLDRKEMDRMLRQSFITFVRVVLDIFWFSRFTAGRIERYVSFDESFNLYFETRPVIAVTGHMGNWEIMGLATSLSGHPSLSVFAPLENPFANRVLERLRGITGQETAAKEGAARKMLRALRQGGRVALVVDQNTLPEDGGQFVEFFGLQTPVSRAAASLSARTGCPIITAFCVANADGSYRFHALEKFACEEGSEPECVQRIAANLEQVVRRFPGQWLWMYKRWKFVPEDESLDRYPFYSRVAPNKG